MRILLSLCLTASVLSSCKFKDVKDGSDDDSITVDPDAPVSFAEVQEKVFEPNCYSCHSNATGNTDGVNLETYANAKALATKLRTTTVERRGSPMPPSGPLGANATALLKAWLDQGTPE